jgi:hypothetical protein
LDTDKCEIKTIYDHITINIFNTGSYHGPKDEDYEVGVDKTDQSVKQVDNDNNEDEKPKKIKKVVYAPIEDMELEGEDLVMKELLARQAKARELFSEFS